MAGDPDSHKSISLNRKEIRLAQPSAQRLGRHRHVLPDRHLLRDDRLSHPPIPCQRARCADIGHRPDRRRGRDHRQHRQALFRRAFRQTGQAEMAGHYRVQPLDFRQTLPVLCQHLGLGARRPLCGPGRQGHPHRAARRAGGWQHRREAARAGIWRPPRGRYRRGFYRIGSRHGHRLDEPGNCPRVVPRHFSNRSAGQLHPGAAGSPCPCNRRARDSRDREPARRLPSACRDSTHASNTSC